AGNTLIVEAPNAFTASWIGTKLRGELADSARQVLGRDVEITVRANAPGPHETKPEIPATPPALLPPKSPAAPPTALLNPRHALDEFVVGPSNQLAWQAAMRIAENPGKEFNPLFLHGHCGLGKTHLLQGICLRFARLHPGKKWIYITAEQFTNEFLEAIRMHKTEAFRRKLRSAELLAIDDVHFLGNKKATQEEFLHTFNQIDASGKQIILASDCAPKQIQALSEQLSSRFVSGMVLRIDSPDLPTRLEILRRRVARNGWNINDTVLMHIARTATSSVRELEGLLLQVVAGINLINTGSADAGSVIASIKDRTAMRGPVPASRILAAVAEHFALAESALTGSGREKIVSAARAIAMYLARQHTGMSFPEIGRALGNKNHSTVIAACQRVEAMLVAGDLLCWNTPTGPKHQAMPDILHDLEAAIRRVR
ncbi:MAG TPA: chromosomal replication initiator protein DnaA, partial [Phycisphaerae bacterium]|nr:chromosomal replication initiator protein DnaA [Phycisphaerae bacterium]